MKGVGREWYASDSEETLRLGNSGAVDKPRPFLKKISLSSAALAAGPFIWIPIDTSVIVMQRAWRLFGKCNFPKRVLINSFELMNVAIRHHLERVDIHFESRHTEKFLRANLALL